MNIEKVHVIEGLARAACHLQGTDASKKLQKRIVDIMDKDYESEEIQALQASNQIKQANINLLADLAIKTAETLRLVKDDRVVNTWLEELENLAKSLKQEDPETPVSVVN